MKLFKALKKKKKNLVHSFSAKGDDGLHLLSFPHSLT